MRLDDLAPRTALLAGLAGWALLAWVLAIAGMGGRLPATPSGAIPGSRLPAIPKDAPGPTLGPLAQYGEIAARPLFATDRRPHPFSLDAGPGQPAQAPTFDFVLTSVLITPQAELAILQKPDGGESWRVRVGEAPDAAPGWRLVAVAPRNAVFEGPEGRKVLELRVYDGKGGVGPTAVAPATGATTVPPGASAAPATAPPPTDANSMPDPAQIEQIRQRIEARREEMRRRAQTATPPATVVPPPANR